MARRPQPELPATGALVHQEVSVQFQGPLPPPSVLGEYERILPGAAERVLRMAELQRDHRSTLETFHLHRDAARADRGQWMGLTVALAGLGAAYGLGLAGHDAVAGVVGGATLVSLVTAFITGTKIAADERRAKFEAMNPPAEAAKLPERPRRR